MPLGSGEAVGPHPLDGSKILDLRPLLTPRRAGEPSPLQLRDRMVSLVPQPEPMCC